MVLAPEVRGLERLAALAEGRSGVDDWISDLGRAKLAAAGIAPPAPVRAGNVVPLTLAVRCPRCGSVETEQLSRFGGG